MLHILFSAGRDKHVYLMHADTCDVMAWLYDMAAKYPKSIRRLDITEGRHSDGNLAVLLTYRGGKR